MDFTDMNTDQDSVVLGGYRVYHFASLWYFTNTKNHAVTTIYHNYLNTRRFRDIGFAYLGRRELHRVARVKLLLKRLGALGRAH